MLAKVRLYSARALRSEPRSNPLNQLFFRFVAVVFFSAFAAAHSFAGTTLPPQTCGSTSCDLPVKLTADSNSIYYVQTQCNVNGKISVPKSLTCTTAAFDMKCPDKDVRESGEFKTCQCNAPIANPGSTYTIHAHIGC